MKKYLLKIPVLIIFAVAFMLAKEEISEKFDFENNAYIKDIAAGIIDDADSLEHANYPASWSKILDKNGEHIGNFILSSPFCDDIRGYAGKVPFILIADTDGNVLGIRLLENRETPSWVKGLKNIDFFKSWNGINLRNLKDHKVDAVSGATYTTRAVIKSVEKRVSIFNGNTEYTPSATSANSLKVIGNKYTPVLYFILIASIILLFIKKLNKYKIVLQILSIIFFGILTGISVSIYLLESLSIYGLSIFTTYATLSMFTLGVIIPLFFNRHFHCFYICPFGNTQELIGKIPVKKIKINSRVIRSLRALRKLIFVSIIIVVSTGIKINLSEIEPFPVFAFTTASATVIISAGVIFVLSVFIKRPWCIYLCPTGQFFDFLKDGIRLK